jgi:hypothetical protein
MVHGIRSQNYLVRNSTYDGRAYFDLLYCSPQNRNYVRIGSYSSWERTNSELKNLIAFLKNLQLSTEGLRIVEHTLLVPPLDSKAFYLELRDRNNNNILVNEEAVSYYQMEEAMRRINNNGLTIIRANGTYTFGLPAAEAGTTPMIMHPVAYRSEQEALKHLELARDMIADYKNGQEQPFHFLTMMNDKKINVNFFSSQLTIVFPAISARFNDPEFRKMAEQIMINNVPAHLYIHFLWLDMPEVEAFEQLYHDWLSIKTFLRVYEKRQSNAASSLALWIHSKVNKNNR